MNYRHLFTGIVLAVSLGTGTGCLGDAPHDNPLDPNSDRFVDEGGVEGQITDRAETPLVGVGPVCFQETGNVIFGRCALLSSMAT